MLFPHSSFFPLLIALLPTISLYIGTMTIEQTVEIDRDRRVLRLDQPLPETAQTLPTRVGFLKGRVSVPSDFDTLGQEEITALFEGKR
jgi:hypothetical protein